MPTPSSTFSYHVSGPVILNAAIGAAFAYVPVGVCEDGIDLEFRPFTHDIKFDGAGGPEGDAAEVIFLNFTVIARCTLVPFGGTYVNSLRSYAQAGATTNGVMRMPGTLYGTDQSALIGIRFSSSDVDGGFQFNTCQVVRAGSAKWSTVETKPTWEFRAINYIDPALANTIDTNVLYSRI